METVTKIIEQVVTYFSGNQMALTIIAYFLGAYTILTAIKFITGVIVKFTKNLDDDVWFTKIVAWVDKYIAPFIILLPHSTIGLNKIFMVVVDGAKWIIGLFQKKDGK